MSRRISRDGAAPGARDLSEKGPFTRFAAAPLLAVMLGLSATLAACQGCKGPMSPNGEVDGAQDVSIRLYAVSAAAGALEPCGCSKDQLGGVDKLAAFIDAEKKAHPNAWMVAAGPLFFLDPALRDDDKQQTLWKAEAMAQAAKAMNLLGWAPGFNDWAGGADTLAKLREATGGALLGANLENVPGAVPTVIREVNGLKIGFFGLSDPKDKVGRTPDSVQSKPAMEAARSAVADLRSKGARVLVGIASLPRGEALRIADTLPEISVLILGKPSEAGDTNDQPKPPVLLGTTLVVETSNHLQTVGVIDLHISGADKGPQPVVLKDAGGVAKAEELMSLAARIRDLEVKINAWSGDPNVKPADLAARKADLEKARADKAKLEGAESKVEGSSFNYKLVEVREALGSEKQVKDAMVSYYKRVNEHNKVAFADRKPKAVEKGQASYIGVDACTDCHDEERKVWDGTPHAKAYATLQKDFKEFNLDCTSCHVTGYDKPGGSTISHTEKLQDVQCEVCHGPGSLHLKDPNKKGLIILKPADGFCASTCHHPPHVEGFNQEEKMKLILGKGHGM
ncbi:MAG: multiheme c-type cytochrome [Polyangiaceae bacterium]